MDAAAIREVLAVLGGRLEREIELTLAGGAALHLAHGFTRGTADIDALVSTPPFDEEFRRLVRVIGEEEELGDAWLNDAAKAFSDVLDEGFSQRRIDLGCTGRLELFALDRQSLILMKLYAMRDQDLEDIADLAPTAAELAFVESQLDRIAVSRPDKAHRISLYLAQGGR